jgi:hypothetical protein
LFVEAKLGEWDGHPAYVRVGRQEIALGSQRLVGSPEWGNMRRNFDGVRVMVCKRRATRNAPLVLGVSQGLGTMSLSAALLRKHG